MAGYSGTPLAKKLGIKAEQRVALLHTSKEAALDFEHTLGELPAGVELTALPPRGSATFDVIVWFVSVQADLEQRFAGVQHKLDPSGGLWVAWPKRASGVTTDVSENTVRQVAL